jgi:hypothetical protein
MEQEHDKSRHILIHLMVMIKIGGLFGIKGSLDSLEIRRFRPEPEPEAGSGIGQPQLFCIKII